MGAAAGGWWGGTAPPGGGRQGGDSPTRTGGDMRGTGRGCGGAGDPATVRECTCSNCTCTDRGAATDSRRLYSPPCSLYSPVHGVQANSLPALPARSCSNVGESVAERRDIIGNLLDGE